MLCVTSVEKKGHYQKCCKSKTAQPGRPSESRQAQVHNLQAQPGTSASQPSVQYSPSDYDTLPEPYEQQLTQPAMFHHVQTIHVKIIYDTSGKHIKPLWLSAANGGLIHQVECEIDSGAGCSVMPLYLHKSLSGILYPWRAAVLQQLSCEDPYIESRLIY